MKRLRVAVLLAITLLPGCQDQRGPTGPGAAPAGQAATVSAEGLWPECPVVVDWLKKNAPEPEGLEVIEWERRTPVTKEMSPQEYGHVNVQVRYRAKNRYGARVIWHQSFGVKDGRVIRADDAWTEG